VIEAPAPDRVLRARALIDAVGTRKAEVRILPVVAPAEKKHGAVRHSNFQDVATLSKGGERRGERQHAVLGNAPNPDYLKKGISFSGARSIRLGMRFTF
jgi:hypothetical protein